MRRNVVLTHVILAVYILSLVSPCLAQSKELRNLFFIQQKRILGIQTSVNQNVLKQVASSKPKSYHTNRTNRNRVAYQSQRSRMGRKHRLWLTKTKRAVKIDIDPSVYTSTGIKNDANFDLNKSARNYLDHVDVKYKTVPTGLEVSSNDGSPIYDDVDEHNIGLLAGLELLIEGNVSDAKRILVLSSQDTEEGSSAQDVLDEIKSIEDENGELGSLELRAKTEDDAVWIDNQLLETTIPCIAIASKGLHSVRIESPDGTNVEFIVRLSAGHKTLIDLQREDSKWVIVPGGNDWLSASSVFLSQQDDVFMQSYFTGDSTGKKHVYVQTPKNTACQWIVLVNGKPWGEATSRTGGWNGTIPEHSKVTVRIRCITGGGRFTIFYGEGINPQRPEFSDR